MIITYTLIPHSFLRAFHFDSQKPFLLSTKLIYQELGLLKLLFLIWTSRTYFKFRETTHWFCCCSLYIPTVTTPVLLQAMCYLWLTWGRVIIKDGKKSTKIDTLRSYFAISHSFIWTPLSSFNKWAPIFDSVLAMIPGLCSLTTMMTMYSKDRSGEVLLKFSCSDIIIFFIRFPKFKCGSLDMYWVFTMYVSFSLHNSPMK